MSLPNFVAADDLVLLTSSLVKRKELQYNSDGIILKISFLAKPDMLYPSLLLAVENYPIAELHIDSVAQQGALNLEFLLQLLCHSNTITVLDISKIIIGLEFF